MYQSGHFDHGGCRHDVGENFLVGPTNCFPMVDIRHINSRAYHVTQSGAGRSQTVAYDFEASRGLPVRVADTNDAAIFANGSGARHGNGRANPHSAAVADLGFPRRPGTDGLSMGHFEATLSSNTRCLVILITISHKLPDCSLSGPLGAYCSVINQKEIELLRNALLTLENGSENLPEFTPKFDVAAAARVLDEVAERMQDNYPYFHPQYAGQMLKPPHPIARMAYALSLWINPNNHALDGGRASSAMEKECIVELASLFHWTKPLGHLTGGGTMANLEALWVADRLSTRKRIVGSDQAHYTHSRISDVLGIEFTPIATESNGRMDLDALEAELRKDDVGTVVVTMGNTGLGAVDPLADIVALQETYDFRLHADAAYGGYFGLAESLSPSIQRHFIAMQQVDSIVIDPHKHGLQPYGCGCVLFRDASVGALYKHDSPYTYFSSNELHLGEISLECSRPGASAVALWATHQMLPPVAGGDFAASLDSCLSAARTLHERLGDSDTFTPILAPDLDIVVYAVNAANTTQASIAAQTVFDNAAKLGLHLAVIDVPSSLVATTLPDMVRNNDQVTCLRSVMMKPEHEFWIDEIVALLEESASGIPSA